MPIKNRELNLPRKRTTARPNNCNKTPREVRHRARQLMAVDMRAKGKSYPQIAKEMRISNQHSP